MDIVGPLPETKSGNLYILTIQDNFTKYSLAIPLPNHQAGTIADAFVKKFICIFVSPKGVLTNQGRDFVSNLLKRLAKRSSFREYHSFSPSIQWITRTITLCSRWISQTIQTFIPSSQNEKLQTYDDQGGKIEKLDNQYTGPHEVLDVLGKGNVKINIKGKPTVVHVIRMKISHINIQNWLIEFELKLKIV